MSPDARIERRSYLMVEWYLCKGDDCDGPRGDGEASIKTLRVEPRIGQDDCVEVTFEGVEGAVWIVPRDVLAEMAQVR